MGLKEFYNNKKVLITGHTGFKGSWLTIFLLQLGAEIIGYALEPNTDPSLFNILKLEDKINNYFSDIRDRKSLTNIIKKHEPDIVFHLAAQPLVRESYYDPHYTFETNIMGTVNLFEAIRNTNSVKSVINITTDKVYKNNDWVYGYRENDVLGGYDPYSSSKASSELITSSYKDSFYNSRDYNIKHNVTISSVRAGNVIGGGDWAKDRLIPDFIRSIVNKEVLKIRYPNSVRPWQHVLDPISGYIWLSYLMGNDGKFFSQAWNFGPNDSNFWPVEKIVKSIIDFWGKGDYSAAESVELHEAGLLKLDISKAIHYLRWNPVYSIKSAIQETVSWYKNFYNGNDDMYEFTVNQLNHYIKMAKELKLNWALELQQDEINE